MYVCDQNHKPEINATYMYYTITEQYTFSVFSLSL